ncbi:hypothetical protein SAMN04487970_102433 [Paenibacillus tianmuensis]|uniref:Peptidase propeptide and YPEB domain-containing protein n=1 Tax=Paenibacillus tianmuensis TaxID=624147 RepID=A0A1G4S7K4_9BACL|nr:hypothetical protein [Paenibacillus tianmuensis]SCW65070.1 hypothetical protein SAMN04487970_102433 [Paenibacillus tianmuensis]
MKLKKAIMASMIVSSMLVTVAGPLPAGVAAAQEQKQPEVKKVKIDKEMASKLQKVMKQFAGKEIKLQDVGEVEFGDFVAVKSVDGKYKIHFDTETGTVAGARATLPINEIDEKDRKQILQKLKKLDAKSEEVQVIGTYDAKKNKFKEILYAFESNILLTVYN